MELAAHQADFDATIFAALQYSCFIDSYGNLYALRDDGATVLVAGPEAGGSVQFQDAGANKYLSWAVTREKLFVFFKEERFHICSALPCVSGGSITEYRRSILIADSQKNVYLLHNTKEYVFCFSVSLEGVSLLASIKHHKGIGAWVENGGLYIFGMRTRQKSLASRLLKRGSVWGYRRSIGTTLRIDFFTKRVHVETAEHITKKLVASWGVDAKNDKERRVRPLLEAWLASVETENGRVLVAGISDDRASWYDELFSEEPDPEDFDAGIAFYRWYEGRVELLRCLHRFYYVGKIDAPDGTLMYFRVLDDWRDVSTEQYFALRVSADMQDSLVPLVMDWKKNGVYTCHFVPIFDARAGAVAEVTTRRKGVPQSFGKHIAMSDDGIVWRFVHQLPNCLNTNQNMKSRSE